MTEKELDAFMSKVLLDAIAFDEDRLEEKIPYAASARHRRQMRGKGCCRQQQSYY